MKPLKKYSSQWPFLLLPVLLQTSANGAVLSVSGWEARRIDSIAGTFTGVQVASSATAGNANAGTSITYNADTVNGDHTFLFSTTADLDGGTADDTFSFVLRVEAYTGSTFDADTSSVTLGLAYDLTDDGLPTTNNQHFGPGWDLDNGQSFILSIESISYSRGESSLDESSSFTGFTNVSKFGGNGAFHVGTSGVETIVTTANGGLDFAGPLTDLAVTSTFNNARFRDLSFEFNIEDSFVVIPEPGTSFLMLSSLLLLSRRSRKS